MYQKIYGCNDITIMVKSNEKKIIDSLTEKYGNYYNDNNGDIDYVINYYVDLKPEITGNLYADREQGDNTDNYIIGNEKELFVYIPEYTLFKDLFIKRIFTTTFVKQFQNKGYAIIHGACFSKDGNGIILTGDKGSGKTTLLLKLLANGYDYIANDKLAVKKCGNNVIACGIPFSMGIIRSDAEKMFNVCKFTYIKEVDKIFIENKDVSDIFGVNTICKTNLISIIFSSFDLSFSGLKMYDVENVVELFDKNTLDKK